MVCTHMKGLKITKGLQIAVNQRTNNTMAKRKWTKGQTMIYKALHKKLKIGHHEHQQKHEVNPGVPEV